MLGIPLTQSSQDLVPKECEDFREAKAGKSEGLLPEIQVAGVVWRSLQPGVKVPTGSLGYPGFSTKMLCSCRKEPGQETL